mmetsp:Transcript_130035/g.404494  ORF Transcript_130035/g.404494 Transcript_130035/m.404494 type:complete len:528 (+) Transcript_130035:83-1666(+)
MGNSGGCCASCKSKEASADAAGEEAPLQVRGGEDAPVVGAPTGAPAEDHGEERREWALRPSGRLTVMMFGMTGAGKSALGNLVAGFDAFDYGDDTISVTNLDSVMRYEAEDGSLVLLDTIGLGDTEIDQKKVVASIRDVALSAPAGVDVLLFVMRNARITDDAIARLIYATEYLWGSQCLLNLYIVVTHASRYLASREEANAWIERQVEINWRFRHIYKIVGENPNRFIFLDNPDPRSGEPNSEQRRAASREAVMRMLCLHPVDAIPPFTFSVMERAKELTAQQAAAPRDKPSPELEHGKGAQAKRPPKQAPSEESALGDAAGQRKLALLRAKADKRLQSDASREVAAATVRFCQRWDEEASDADAGAGASKASSSTAPDGLRSACKRMASYIISKALSRKSSSKSSSGADTGAGSAAAEPGGEPVHSEAWELILDDILKHIKSSMMSTPEKVFAALDESGSGAITPLDFTQFLRNHMSGIRHQHVGGLWRRADLNCDGQLDLEEFCTLLNHPRERREPPPAEAQST